ncbi:hypothetical protein [Cerasicoccus maritimus]|uniref:hypothetical protein n=1 Tax=Cerasicoccus maritimus TaxID=490089 RepID=UPI0028526790|nr:hypothetical protein [Cerasicoccus maritimus]
MSDQASDDANWSKEGPTTIALIIAVPVVYVLIMPFLFVLFTKMGWSVGVLVSFYKPMKCIEDTPLFEPLRDYAFVIYKWFGIL